MSISPIEFTRLLTKMKMYVHHMLVIQPNLHHFV
ncbi:hypothetical protein LINPERHAP2_LOCUS20028 [Linum perenne]